MAKKLTPTSGVKQEQGTVKINGKDVVVNSSLAENTNGTLTVNISATGIVLKNADKLLETVLDSFLTALEEK